MSLDDASETGYRSPRGMLGACDPYLIVTPKAGPVDHSFGVTGYSPVMR